MFSKPLAFVLLALGCLTAAAGGAYVATRHNMSDTGARQEAAPAALTSPAGDQSPAAAPRAVAETEAAITPKSEPVQAEKPSAPAPVQAETPAPDRTPHATEPARAPESKPAPAVTVAKNEPPPAHPAQRTVPPAQPSVSAQGTVPSQRTVPPAQRTVPMTNPGAPAVADTTSPVQAGAPIPMPPAKPAAEPARPATEEPQPEPVHVPQYDELILPAAAVIGLQVETTLSSERARVEDRVDARVSRDVMSGGRVAIPAGSRVIGSVTTVDHGGKVKEPARLGIRFHTLVLADGTQVSLHTDPIYRVGEDPTAGSAKKIGGAAIGGAIIGAIIGGGKGAAIGGATGAGAGTAAVMAGDRNPATLRQGEYLNVKLSSPATITVERRE